MQRKSIVIALLLSSSTAFKLEQKSVAPTKPFVSDTGIPHLAGALYNPGASKMDPNALVWQRAAIHDGKVHGEKNFQGDANELQAYTEKQETAANVRIPYQSTLVQLSNAPTAIYVSDTGIPHLSGPLYNPGASTMDPNALVWQRAAIHDGKVHGEKNFQADANTLQEYTEKQEAAANVRIPYQSTLLQTTEMGGPAIPSAPFVSDTGIPHLAGALYNPGASKMDPNALVWQRAAIHDGKVHGEKNFQGDANELQAYTEKQETAANVRIPYQSTLLQTQQMDTDEDAVAVAGETFQALGQVPLNFQFVNTKDDYSVDDDFSENEDPQTIEIASDVPRDFRFVHIQNSDGELMKQEPVNLIETMENRDVPIGYNFVHLQNQDGDDIMRWI